MNLLITGASGFIGGHLVSAAKAAGHVVTEFRHRETQAIRGDVMVGDLAALSALPRNRYDVVIHAAGLSWPGPYTVGQLARANVQGTSRLIDAMVAANVPRMVFLSTLSVLGTNISASSVASEKSFPINPDAYGLSKLLCERMLVENSKFSSMSIRLPAVLGKGAARHFLARTAAQALDGGEIHAHSPNRKFNNVLWINDLCDFILNKSLQQLSAPQHEIVNLAAASPISMDDTLAQLRICLKSKSRVVWGPTPSMAQPASAINIDYAAGKYGFNPLSVLDAVALYAEACR